MITNNEEYTKYSLSCISQEPNDQKSYTVHNKTVRQKDIYNWIYRYNFTHFITIRLQKHHEKKDFGQAIQQLRIYMKQFEKNLLGRWWNKKHLFFIAFGERGLGCYWHFHILFNFNGIDEEKMIKSVESVEKVMKLSWYNIHISTINYLPEQVIAYCNKEIRFNQNVIGDTSTIVPSTVLFDLPYEQTYHYQFNETNTKEPSECINMVENNPHTDEHKIYNKIKSFITGTLNYFGSLFDQYLFYFVYIFPTNQSYYLHRQLYDDLDDGYG